MPIQPKKAKTSFFSFFDACRDRLYKEQKLSIVDAAKKAGETWTKMTDKEKSSYHEMAKKDKLRYNKETEQVIKMGYFILDDGRKSCDVLVPKKRHRKQQCDKCPTTDAKLKELQAKLVNAKKEREQALAAQKQKLVGEMKQRVEKYT